MKKKNNKGYIIAEAAMTVPVFLFACVLLIYMVKIAYYQEMVHFTASEYLVMMAAHTEDDNNHIKESDYESLIKDKVRDSTTRDITISAGIDERDDTYEVDLRYRLNMNLPFGLFDDMQMRDVIAARKWNGGTGRGEILGFESMSREDDNQYVFIFPKYGERYHEGGCRYLYLFENGYIKCVSISEAVAEGYTSCQVCH